MCKLFSSLDSGPKSNFSVRYLKQYRLPNVFCILVTSRKQERYLVKSDEIGRIDSMYGKLCTPVILF